MLLPVCEPEVFWKWLALIFRVRNHYSAGRLAGVISLNKISGMQG